MSISEKQLIANRQNAKKSTGPKTAEGKKNASQNSLKHGLYARDIIINSPHLKENKDEYDFLIKSLIDELKPTTIFQELLVRKIANCFWRSRRALAAETAQVNRQLGNINSDIYSDSVNYQIIDDFDNSAGAEEVHQSNISKSQEYANQIIIKSLPHHSVIYNIQHYEMRLDRQMLRYYKLLKKLQYSEETEWYEPGR